MLYGLIERANYLLSSKSVKLEDCMGANAEKCYMCRREVDSATRIIPSAYMDFRNQYPRASKAYAGSSSVDFSAAGSRRIS